MKRLFKLLLAFALVAVIAFGSFSLISAEQATTKENPSVFGDVNMDGIVNIKDATDIQKVIAKIKQTDEISQHLADVNEDGVVNIKDATEIQKWLAKLPSNDKIGVPDEEVTEPATVVVPSTCTEPSTTSDEEPDTTQTPASSVVLSDPVETESTKASTTTSSDDRQEVTDPAESSTATDPTETTETTAPELDPYQKEVMDIFAEQGHNPYEQGMFYKVIYNYNGNSNGDTDAPEYVLIWTSLGAVADEVFELTIGDYVLTCPGHCYPYNPGYYIYIPSSDTMLTIEEAYHQKLEGLETVFEEAPVFRPIEVEFKIVDEVRINNYGSEETELFLLHHASAEEALTSKFTTGWFDVPELNLPKDDKGFYCDNKIYLASLNFLGGGNSSQFIYKITVADGVLTVYRYISSPENQTPDMNYQYVLIELDASLLESISELKDVTVKN